jgi:hypothetical protein
MKLSRPTALILLIVVLWGGWGLRLYQLDALPLRGDEAFSAQYWAGLPLTQSLQTIATIEPHPPLTYSMFRAWGVLFGIQHELILRLLPTLGNMLGIAALYALGKRFHGRAAGLLAAVLWALHPFEIFHAQDFRNYGVWAGMSAVTVWAGVRTIQRRYTSDWVLFGIAAFVSSLTFYMELLTLGALGLFVLGRYWHERRFVLQWIGVNLLVGSAAALSFFVLQAPILLSGSYAGTTQRLEVAQLLTRFLPTLNFGERLPAEWQPILGVGLLVLLVVFGTLLVRQRDQRFVIVLALLPPLAIALLSLRLGVFDPRYALCAVTGFILWVSLALAHLLEGGSWRKWAGVGILAGWLLLNSYALWQHYQAPANRPNWRGLAAYLAANAQTEDLVIQLATDAGFGYYYDEVFRVPVPDIGLPSNFDQPPAEVEAELAAFTPQYRSVWMVASTFPDWAAAGVVEAWLPQHLQQVRRTHIQGLPIQQYMDWAVNPRELPTEALGVFPDLAILRGAQVFLPPEPTAEITLWLYWQAQQTTPKPLKVFVHLSGDLNSATGTPLWAQADSFPQQGRIQTATWQADAIYRDVYALDVSTVPAGNYQLVVGWYDPESGERQLTDTQQDHLFLQTLTLP